MPRKRKKFDLRRSLIAQARRIFWFYYRPKCLKYHRKEDENGNKYWECVACTATINEAKNAQVDHIAPVMDTDSSTQSWDVYYDRLFVEPDKTQILCKPCHSAKTKIENAKRRSK